MSDSTIFFSHYLINNTILGKSLWKITCAFLSSLQLLSETRLIKRRIQARYYHTCTVHRYSRKVAVTLAKFQLNSNFSTYCQRNTQKFHENLSSGSRAVPWGRKDGRPNTRKLTVAFRNLRERLKNLLFLGRAVRSLVATPTDLPWVANILCFAHYRQNNLEENANCLNYITSCLVQ